MIYATTCNFIARQYYLRMIPPSLVEMSISIFFALQASDVIEILQIWFSTYNLKLIDDKTKSSTISSTRKLTYGKSCNFLGIMVYDSLTWNTHIRVE